MPQRILVVSPGRDTAKALLDDLQALGYPADSAPVLASPAGREHPPALVIVDLQFARDTPQGQWDSWLQDCHRAHIACLAFDISGPTDPTTLARLEPLCDVLAEPGNREMLKDKVRSLLTVRKLSRQLEASRQQLSHYQGELQAALQSAASIQRSLIPKRQQTFGNLNFAWKYMPCKQVGGDLFNILQLDEQTVMIYLLDVSGHGISSAMVTVSVHQSLSMHTGQLVKRPLDHPPYYEISSPQWVLQQLELEYPFERFEEFFTISYLLINPGSGRLRYSNAGHLPPILQRADGRIERLDRGGTVIGVGGPIEFEEGECPLGRGDRLFMFTDGITEHLGKSGELFGEQRLLEQLSAQRGKPIEGVPRDTLIALREFGGSTLPVDDVTLIAIEYN